jgi:hypothetical protein
VIADEYIHTDVIVSHNIKEIFTGARQGIKVNILATIEQITELNDM